MNAIELLKEDHREALELIEQLENLDGSLDADEGGIEFAPTELFTQLKSALTMHTQVEEQVFYPAMREFEETRDLIVEAVEEHQVVDQILEEMRSEERRVGKECRAEGRGNEVRTSRE